jgi:hypothetical protein
VGKPERVQQRVVHEGEGGAPHQPRREPVIRRERRQQPQRGLRDRPAALVEREMLTLGMTQAQVDRVPEFSGPGSQSELIAGVGHFMMVERPGEINKRILGFLDGAAT